MYYYSFYTRYNMKYNVNTGISTMEIRHIDRAYESIVAQTTLYDDPYEALSKATEALNHITNVVKSVEAMAKTKSFEAAFDFASKAGNAAGNAVTKAGTVAGGAISNAGNATANFGNKATEFVKTAWQKIIGFFQNLIAHVVQFVGEQGVKLKFKLFMSRFGATAFADKDGYIENNLNKKKSVSSLTLSELGNAQKIVDNLITKFTASDSNGGHVGIINADEIKAEFENAVKPADTARELSFIEFVGGTGIKNGKDVVTFVSGLADPTNGNQIKILKESVKKLNVLKNKAVADAKSNNAVNADLIKKYNAIMTIANKIVSLTIKDISMCISWASACLNGGSNKDSKTNDTNTAPVSNPTA